MLILGWALCEILHVDFVRPESIQFYLLLRSLSTKDRCCQSFLCTFTAIFRIAHIPIWWYFFTPSLPRLPFSFLSTSPIAILNTYTYISVAHWMAGCGVVCSMFPYNLLFSPQQKLCAVNLHYLPHIYSINDYHMILFYWFSEEQIELYRVFISQFSQDTFV